MSTKSCCNVPSPCLHLDICVSTPEGLTDLEVLSVEVQEPHDDGSAVLRICVMESESSAQHWFERGWEECMGASETDGRALLKCWELAREGAYLSDYKFVYPKDRP